MKWPAWDRIGVSDSGRVIRLGYQEYTLDYCFVSFVVKNLATTGCTSRRPSRRFNPMRNRGKAVSSPCAENKALRNNC